MRLSAFKIQNFRSIINTSWTKLAQDNITALIGQNESGKTSILEALNSFYKAVITEDILRSDLSWPVVSCKFQLSKSEIQTYAGLTNLSEEIALQIKKTGTITLNRKWISKNDSELFYGNDELLAVIKERKEKEQILLDKLVNSAEKILNDTSDIVEKVGAEEIGREELSAELTLLQAKIDKKEKFLQRNRNERKKELIREEMVFLKKEESSLKLRYEGLDSSFQKLNKQLNSFILKSEYSEKFLNAREEYQENNKKVEEIFDELNGLKDHLEFGTNERHEEGQLVEKMKDLNDNLSQSRLNDSDLKSEFLFSKKCFSIALAGAKSGNNIESRAWLEVKKNKTELSLKQIAAKMVDDIPEFSLFEDFSSLLPNRIDLEDILDMNKNVEGYNAAKNFLIVSGLDARFFRESSSRILKQKIENLNSNITVHFQDYWRQSLGRKNKIRLNFELEHYDHNHPDKKGKPFLEFWIKDEYERLYPKQRSRGVRWFLSFYLELKATAMSDNKKAKLLLIDEPGLSLHARAQEDVLKVFEDLKENIQIIYSTHSPHLVNTDKIYRLLAVQRADESDDRSETMIFDAQSFNKVSGDTLSPIYTLLGSQISESNFIQERNNIILEDTVSFYYIKTLFEIFRPDEKAYFLPATGMSSVPLLVNLMTGWKLKFGVILTDSSGAKDAVNDIRENLFRNDNQAVEKNIKIYKTFSGFENLFSTIDFKKHLLKKRTGITEENMEYIATKNLNRIQLAAAFALYCQNKSVKPEDFDDESRENIEVLIRLISDMLS